MTKLVIHLELIRRLVAAKGITPKISCSDGFKVSVQASHLHYCSPREDTGPWDRVELGFPTEADSLIQSYAEDREDPTGTVYPYVPMEVVVDLIEKHGGFKS